MLWFDCEIAIVIPPTLIFDHEFLMHGFNLYVTDRISNFLSMSLFKCIIHWLVRMRIMTGATTISHTAKENTRMQRPYLWFQKKVQDWNIENSYKFTFQRLALLCAYTLIIIRLSTANFPTILRFRDPKNCLGRPFR